MKNTSIIAGIDPGVKTGLAVWDCALQDFLELKTCSIVEAMAFVKAYERQGLDKLIFEDARLRKWFENAGREKLQGAGSIKRDCGIWEEFCKFYKIPFETVKPSTGQTKWKADYFQKVTGYTGRTSEHARDAGVLVFGIQ